MQKQWLDAVGPLLAEPVGVVEVLISAETGIQKPSSNSDATKALSSNTEIWVRKDAVPSTHGNAVDAMYPGVTLRLLEAHG
jgi:hypothetical protein